MRHIIGLVAFVFIGGSASAQAELKKALEDAKAKALTYKEYEGLEHLLIVREALPDAFAMFDKLVTK